MAKELFDKKILLLLFMVSIIWGINPSINRLLLEYANPVIMIAYRFIISSFTLFAYLIYKKQFRIPPLKHLLFFFILGFFSISITNTMNIAGFEYSTVTNCSLIISVSPLLISVSAFIFFKEKLFALQWIGIILVALSTIYLITDGNPTEIFGFDYNKGDLLFLIGQVTWTIYTLMLSKTPKDISLLEVVAWPCFFGAIINFIVASYLGLLELPILNSTSISALIFSIWVNSMGAVLLWSYGVKQAGSQIASIFVNLATLISIFIGIFLLGEKVTNAIIVGSIGILGGVLLLTQYKFFLFLYQKSFPIRKS